MPEREVFLAALDKEPAERAAYLDAACGGGALRRRVEALFRSHAGAHDFLAVPAVEQLSAADTAADLSAADTAACTSASSPVDA